MRSHLPEAATRSALPRARSGTRPPDASSALAAAPRCKVRRVMRDAEASHPDSGRRAIVCYPPFGAVVRLTTLPSAPRTSNRACSDWPSAKRRVSIT